MDSIIGVPICSMSRPTVAVAIRFSALFRSISKPPDWIFGVFTESCHNLSFAQKKKVRKSIWIYALLLLDCFILSAFFTLVKRLDRILPKDSRCNADVLAEAVNEILLAVVAGRVGDFFDRQFGGRQHILRLINAAQHDILIR